MGGNDEKRTLTILPMYITSSISLIFVGEIYLLQLQGIYRDRIPSSRVLRVPLTKGFGVEASGKTCENAQFESPSLDVFLIGGELIGLIVCLPSS